MFFLKSLPSQTMVESYADRLNDIEPRTISDALGMMRKASLMIRDIDRHFARHGLSQLKFLILVVIDREGEGASLTQSDILNRIDISKPVLSRTVRMLVDDSCLIEKSDPKDRRASRLTLTDRGRYKLLGLLPDYFRILQRHMSSDVLGA